MPPAFDPVNGIRCSMLPVINDTDRLRKVPLQRVHDECRLDMKTKNMVREGLPVEDNLSVVPALDLPDDVWFLPHRHPLLPWMQK